MLVEIWSDVVCPWCYVGKQRFGAALSAFEHRDDVRVVHRAFQLDPGAESDHPGDASPSHTERLAAKFGKPADEIGAMHAQMTELGAADGIDFRFEQVRSANTIDAHRLLHLAADLGLGREVEDRFFRAVFTDGEPIGDRDTLRRVAVDAGLPAAEVDDVLATQRYTEEFVEDVERAQRLGISGVPFFVLDGRYGVSGAQSVEVLASALDQAYAARA